MMAQMLIIFYILINICMSTEIGLSKYGFLFDNFNTAFASEYG
jgi:hypothetical protein